ncbi:CHAT domain-containing protein [bacterium]|nr:CHAT domain-containing protein [bacterium]
MDENIYLDFAARVDNGNIEWGATESQINDLPLPSADTLDRLFQQAQKIYIQKPKKAWALMKACDLKFQQASGAKFLSGKAAWYHAWTANKWARPALAREATTRARESFQQLGEEGWVALSNWQYYALAYTLNTFSIAAPALEKVLHCLKDRESFFQSYLPEIHLSLASAYFLIQNQPEAIKHIETGIQGFEDHGNTFGFHRGLLFRSSVNRAQGNYDISEKLLDTSLQFFEQNQSTLDTAFTIYQLALLNFFRGKDYPDVVQKLSTSKALFEKMEMPLRAAYGANALGQVYTHLGKFPEAHENLTAAKKVFEAFNIYGGRADNLNDLGRLEYARDRFSDSITFYQKALDFYERLEISRIKPYSLNNIGKAYIDQGHYQTGLAYIESAIDAAYGLGNNLFIARSHWFMGEILHELGDLKAARKNYEQAWRLYEDNGNRIPAAKVLLDLARIDHQLGDQVNAQDLLGRILSLPETPEFDLQKATARLLLGEWQIKANQLAEGKEKLDLALRYFTENQMVFHQALGLLVQADYYQRQNASEAIVTTLEAVSDLSNTIFPKIESIAHAKLALHFYHMGDNLAAREHIDRAINPLERISTNFKQPALAANYFQMHNSFSQLIEIALQMESNDLLVKLIEASKAMALTSQLASDWHFDVINRSNQISNLVAEINWLQEKIVSGNENRNPDIFHLSSGEALRELKAKIAQYQTAVEKTERQVLLRSRQDDTEIERFDLDQFRRILNTRIGENWWALHYFLEGHRLIIAALTSQKIMRWAKPLSWNEKFLLQLASKIAYAQQGLQEQDLKNLGDLLIPAEVASELNGNEALVIVPHGELHSIPWAGLQLEDGGFLINRCSLTTTPSLRVLQILLNKNKSAFDFSKKMFIGVSKHKDPLPDLPYVKTEAGQLKQYFQGTNLLLEEQANWENFQKILQQTHETDQQLELLHIASHFGKTQTSERLTNLSLHDRTVWLDEFRSLCYFPRRVIISGCSGIRSKIFAGDEHLGIVTTCFVAGAQQVVGSLWLVDDAFAADFMEKLYGFLSRSGNLSQSLSLAQRWAIDQGISWEKWAGFICQGTAE